MTVFFVVDKFSCVHYVTYTFPVGFIPLSTVSFLSTTVPQNLTIENCRMACSTTFEPDNRFLHNNSVHVYGLYVYSYMLS